MPCCIITIHRQRHRAVHADEDREEHGFPDAECAEYRFIRCAGLPTETVRMAMVVLATLPIVMAYPFFQRYFVQGLTVGSVKG